MTRTAVDVNRLFVLSLALWGICAAARPSSAWCLPARDVPPRSPAAEMRRILSHPALRGARVGIVVKHAADWSGEFSLLYQHHPDLPLVPASNMKLLTAAAALRLLGPDYRFTTRLLAEAPPREERLAGPLIVLGGGDPTWGPPFHRDPLVPLREMARELRSLGVREIEGDLVVDDSRFDRHFFGHGWRESDRFEPYAATVSALSLNRNHTTLLVTPGAPGRPARIAFYPPHTSYQVTNRTRTARGPTTIAIRRGRGSNTVTVSGRISPRSRGIAIPTNVQVPPLFTGSVMAHILAKEGIRLRGSVRLAAAADHERWKRRSRHPLVEQRSPPLLDLLRETMKESDNFIAEHVWKALGAHVHGMGSLENSRLAIRKFLGEARLPEDGLVVADGSGLSSWNRMSAAFLVQLLEEMVKRTPGEQGEIFTDLLPRGGIDGTLEKRLSDVRITAKTGAITGVSALSGYARTELGKVLIFSILVNNHKVHSGTIRELEDRMVRRWVKWAGGEWGGT